MTPVCIGSQLFINKHNRPDEIRGWVEAMAEAQLKVIRLFVIWDHLEASPGRWDFVQYDAVFDAAAQRGMWVVPTLMSVSPPGWMLRTGGVQAVANLEDPEILAAGEGYIRQVVGRWKDHPALHSWILWNEASRLPPRTPQTLLRYQQFLRERFAGDVSAMNALQFRQYAAFEDVGKTRESGAMDLEFAGFAEKVFWEEFAVSELCTHLRRIGAIVRELDPQHPLQVNPHGLAYYVQHAGQSIWREAACVDFLGCSSHPVWHSTRFDRSRWGRSCGIFADLMRSATPDAEGEFWVTELQGGTTLLSAERADCPDPQELERWMWEGIGAGARATVFWCFNWREEGYEAGEWHLLRLDGSPSPRLRAATRVADTLESHAEWFEPARPRRPQMLMLRSDAAERLAWVENSTTPDPRDPRNRMRVADSASGAALLLADLGWDCGSVEEKGLGACLADPSRKPRLLIVPGLEALCDGTLELLLNFARGGGLVIADGPVGWKDPLGRIAQERRTLWNELCGFPLADVEAWRCTQNLPPDGETPSPWWLRVVAGERSADVCGEHTQGDTLLMRHRVGLGQVVCIGTWFFHRFLVGDYSGNRRWFSTLLQALPAEPLQLAEPGPGQRLRLLQHPRGFCGVLICETGETSLLIRTAMSGTLERQDGIRKTLAQGETLSIPLDSAGCACFLFEILDG